MPSNTDISAFHAAMIQRWIQIAIGIILSAERRKFSLVDSETQEALARANPTIPWQRMVDEVQPFGNSRQPFLEA